MFRKYLAKEQVENWENTHHALHFGTFPFRCHASRPALQPSCSSVSLSSSSPSNLFLQFVTAGRGAAHLSKPLWSLSCHTSFSWHIVMSLEKCVCRLHTKPAIWSIFTYISYMNYFNHYTSTQNPASFWFKIRQWHDTPYSTPACLRCDFQVVRGLPGQNVASIWWLAATAKLSWSKNMLERQVQPKKNMKIKGDKFVDVLVYTWISGWFQKKENYLWFKYFASPSFWHATRADPILIVLGWHWSHSICFKIAKAVGHALPRSQAATAAP